MTWTLVGCPTAFLAAFLANSSARGNSSSVGLETAGWCGDANPAFPALGVPAHVVTITGGTALAADVGGFLRAGYVYNVMSTALFAASPTWAGAPFFPQQQSSVLRSPSPLGRVALLVSAMSARLSVGRATLPPIAIAASASAALLLATHTPPLAGSINVSPGVGVALSTLFTMQADGWSFWNGSSALRETSSLEHGVPSPLLTAQDAAAWVLRVVPMSDDSICDVASIALTGSLPLAPPPTPGVCEASVSGLVTGLASTSPSAWSTVLNTTDAPASITAPAWLLQLYLAASLGAGGLSVTGVAESLQALCGSTRNFATTALSTNASASYEAPEELRVQFRVQLSGVPDPSIPVIDSSTWAVSTAGILESQSELRVAGAWPGVPLGPLSFSASGASQLVSAANTTGSDGAGLSRDASLVALPAVSGNTVTPVVVYAFVVDALGAVGVALSSVILALPLSTPQSTDAVTVSTFAAGLSGSTLTTDAAASSPYVALLSAAAVGSALSRASSSTVASGEATAGNATAAELLALQASNTVTRTVAVSAVGVSVAAIAANASSTEGSVRVDDALLGLVAGTLQALTADVLELTPETGLQATVVLQSSLAYAVPNPGRNASSNTVVQQSGLSVAALPFPLIIGNSVLSSLVNVEEAARSSGSSALLPASVPYPGSAKSDDTGIAPNVSSALLGVLAALTTTALRASVPVGPGTVSANATQSMVGGPSSAFDSNAPFCGSTLSLSAARVSSGGSSVGGRLTTVAVQEPSAPCDSDASSIYADVTAASTVLLSQALPSVGLPLNVLSAATRNTSAGAGSPVDVAVVQWGSSPYPAASGWQGTPGSLDVGGLASRVLSVVLQTPTGTGLLQGGGALPESILVRLVVAI